MATQSIELPEIEVSNLKHSEHINELAASLAVAHKSFKAVKKNSVNPYFKSKYADLEAIIDATDKALAEQGVVPVQSPLAKGDKAGVTTMLIHTSGQWMRADLLLPVAKGDAQGIGSAITYARRYSLQSFLNVAAEADDDANAAAGKESEAKAATMPKPPKKEAKPNGEDSFKLKFWRTAKAKGKSDDEIRNIIGFLGYEHTEEIPLNKQQEALQLAAE